MPVYIYTTLVGPPGSSDALPNGINNQGQIVGSYNDAITTHGFLYSAGAYTAGNRSAGTAARSTGNPARVPRIAGRRAYWAPREFMRTSLAEQDRACGPKPSNRGGINSRKRNPGGGGADGRRHVGGEIIVLDAERDSVKRAAPSTRLQFAIGGFGVGQRCVIDCNEALQNGIALANPVECRFDQIDRRQVPVAKRGCEPLDRLIDRLH